MRARIALLILAFPMASWALPWDIDMFRQQSLKANEVARAPAEGTVPLGHRPFLMTNDEANDKLENPVPYALDSIRRGKRLYSVNCLTCHGEKGAGDGPVGAAMAVPNILADFYKNTRKDGMIYGIMMNGGSNMPRYGYKFSEQERWDIVNYVRYLQGRALTK